MQLPLSSNDRGKKAKKRKSVYRRAAHPQDSAFKAPKVMLNEEMTLYGQQKNQGQISGDLTTKEQREIAARMTKHGILFLFYIMLYF